MSEFITNDLQTAWRHYRDNIKTYRVGNDILIFTHDLDENAITHIHILHFEINDFYTLHELIKTMIDDMPIEVPCYAINTLPTLGSITLRNIGNHLKDYGLDNFCYKSYKFVKDGENGVLDVANPDYGYYQEEEGEDSDEEVEEPDEEIEEHDEEEIK